MKLILILICLANLFVGVSYLLTHAYTGAVTCFVGGTQTIINYFFERKNKKLPGWLITLYAITFVTVNLLVFQAWVDILALLASLVFILCICQKSGAKYRRCSFLNTSLWIVYDCISMSYGPLLTHGIQLSFVISGMILHDRRKNKTAG